MRALIRPTLFLIARLGLFLAVVAWIVSQWRQTGIGTPMGSMTIVSQGWICFVYDGPNTWSIQSEAKVSSNGWMFESISGIEEYGGIGFSFCGITFLRPTATFMSVSIRHWLVVTIFALFYGVLHFIYRRKLGGSETDE